MLRSVERRFKMTARWVDYVEDCWRHYAPFVMHYGLLQTLGDYIRKRMVAKNLMTEEEVQRVLRGVQEEEEAKERWSYEEWRAAEGPERLKG